MNQPTYSTCPRIADNAVKLSLLIRYAHNHNQSLQVATDVVCSAVETQARIGLPRRATEVDIAVSAVATLLDSNKNPSEYKKICKELNSILVDADLNQSADEVKAEITLEGLDSERLFDAIISFEALRHVRLIFHEANKMARRFETESADNMVGYGWRGLRHALRKFDPDLGLRFATYACTRISGSIRDGLREESHLAKRLWTKDRAVSKSESDLADALGRTPTSAEIAKEVGMTLSEFAETRRYAVPLSVSSLRASLEGVDTEISALTTPDITSLAAETSVLTSEIEQAISALPADIRQAAKLVLYEGKSFMEAERVTEIPARQIKKKCAEAKILLQDSLSGWEHHLDEPVSLEAAF